MVLYRAHFNFSQAETCNGLKSVGTICYRADGSCSSTFQSRRLDYIFSRGISIPCAKLNRSRIEYKSEVIGNAFEHFIYQEIYAHSRYSGLDYTISYWRTASQLEVDFVFGAHQVALEVKASDKISEKHLRGLYAFMEEYRVKRSIIVCAEPLPRLHKGIQILPWQFFLQQLWAGDLIAQNK